MSSGWRAGPNGDREMHGLAFFLSPECHRHSVTKHLTASAVSAPRSYFVKRRAANLNAALTFMLAAALCINIALLAHYIG
jgi:hypothetical protein